MKVSLNRLTWILRIQGACYGARAEEGRRLGHAEEWCGEQCPQQRKPMVEVSRNVRSTCMAGAERVGQVAVCGEAVSAGRMRSVGAPPSCSSAQMGVGRP